MLGSCDGLRLHYAIKMLSLLSVSLTTFFVCYFVFSRPLVYAPKRRIRRMYQFHISTIVDNKHQFAEFQKNSLRYKFDKMFY